MRNSAVFHQGHAMPAAVVVGEAPIYAANARELVVRVEAIGINPSDYKLRDGIVPTVRPHSGGSDIVGIVEQIGEGVRGFALGERVAGYTPFHFSLFFSENSLRSNEGVLDPDSRYAAFQHHTVVFAEGMMKIPRKFSIPAAATLGCAYATAALALWGELRYKRPTSRRPSHDNNGTLLVWGGSSCVGAYAIQFARVSGIRVVATASPHNFQYVRSLGADRVYDYRAPNVVEILRAENIVDAIDAISAYDTPRKVRAVLRGRGGRVATTLPLDMQWPPEITACYVGVPKVYKEDYKDLMRWLYHDFSPRFIGEGLVRPHNVHLVEGTLEDVNGLMDLQKEGKVSGKKPVLLFNNL